MPKYQSRFINTIYYKYKHLLHFINLSLINKMLKF